MITDQTFDIGVGLATESDCDTWNDYAIRHSNSTIYHLYQFKKVFESSYGHNTYYLISWKIKAGSQEGEAGDQKTKTMNPVVLENYELSATGNEVSSWNSFHELSDRINESDSGEVTGILPIVHLEHLLFGNSLISTPFFDIGGILADDEETEKALLSKAVKLAKTIGAKSIELRHAYPIYEFNLIQPISHVNYSAKSNKARMLLALPESPDELMKSFKSKLRSQIKKPTREGLTSKIGGHELLEDFYKVFAVNMRDLGSPVHSKELIKNVITEFTDDAQLVLVYKGKEPVAGSAMIGFKDTLHNPWSSALRKYSRLSPNMLLYWSMLEYACSNGYKYFDFGRSTPGEGTYRFKEQWGAKPQPLYWQYISLDGKPIDAAVSEKSSFELAARVWRKLPVSVANLIGPHIRKYIGL